MLYSSFILHNRDVALQVAVLSFGAQGFFFKKYTLLATGEVGREIGQSLTSEMPCRKHQQAVGEEGAKRFAYVPLPTIRPQGVVGSINRVLVVEPPGGTGNDAVWARRLLAGQELLEHQQQSPVALLSPAPASDWVIRQYTGDPGGAAVWSTVTPVVLPGYDDPDHLRRRLQAVRNPADQRRLYERLQVRIEGLLRKALVQAGFPATLARHAGLEWRGVGFRPGLDLATGYRRPEHLRAYPRYHVRLHWRDADGRSVPVRGPVVLGAGRYYGLGLFAIES